jgi:hypothetical protein
MKKLFIPFAKTVMLLTACCLFAAAVIGLTGCQDNDITALFTSFDKEQRETSDTIFRGIIRLDGVLGDPYPVGNSFYRIFGEIEFEMKNIINNPMLITSQRLANIHLITSAEFQYNCTVCSPSPEDELSGFLSEVSDDRVALAGSSVSLLEKAYTIQGREDGMLLKIRLIVSNSGVELSAMWLALPNKNPEATVINHY